MSLSRDIAWRCTYCCFTFTITVVSFIDQKSKVFLFKKKTSFRYKNLILERSVSSFAECHPIEIGA